MFDIDDGASSLRDFIEENHNLLSAMAVLAAIASFVNGLPIHWLAATLFFLAIAGVITIWFELNAQFPEKGSARLFLFKQILFLGLLGFILYWFLAFPSFWNIFFFLPLFLTLFFMLLTVLRQLTAIPFIKRLFGKKGERSIWQKILIFAYGFAVFVALDWLLWLSVGTSPVFNYTFELIRLNFH